MPNNFISQLNSLIESGNIFYVRCESDEQFYFMAKCLSYHGIRYNNGEDIISAEIGTHIRDYFCDYRISRYKERFLLYVDIGGKLIDDVPLLVITNDDISYNIGL